MGAENRQKFEALHKEMKVLSDHRHGFVSSFIVECAWNFDRLEWELIQNRPDKDKANFISVCTDTLRVMMDNVTESELCEACKPIIDVPDAQMYGGHNNNNNHNNEYYHPQQHQHQQPNNY